MLPSSTARRAPPSLGRQPRMLERTVVVTGASERHVPQQPQVRQARALCANRSTLRGCRKNGPRVVRFTTDQVSSGRASESQRDDASETSETLPL